MKVMKKYSGSKNVSRPNGPKKPSAAKPTTPRRIVLKGEEETEEQVAARLAAPRKRRATPRKRVVKIDMAPEQKYYPPVVMTPRALPGTEKPGPYCEVLVPVSFSKLVNTGRTVKKEIDGVEKMVPVQRTINGVRNASLWVHVLTGDDRNGAGLIRQMPMLPCTVDLKPGEPIRFAGGTAQSPAKFIERLASI